MVPLKIATVQRKLLFHPSGVTLRERNTMKFEEWFNKQFDDYSLSDKEKSELQNIVLEGMDAEEQLRLCSEWEKKREAALYAWQVKHD